MSQQSSAIKQKKSMVLLSYLFLYDFSHKTKLFKNANEFPACFDSLGIGALRVCSGNLVEFANNEVKPNLLKIFKSFHQNRLKEKFLIDRKSIVLELCPQFIKELTIKDGNKLKTIDNKPISLELAVEFSELGIMTFHTFISPSISTPYENCIELRSPSNIFLEVDIQLTHQDQLMRLYGRYSLMDIIRFYSICLISCIENNKKQLKLLSDKTLYKEELYKVSKKYSKTFLPYDILEFYPSFSFSVNLDNNALKDFCLENSKILRAIITGDKNWDKKSDEIVSTVIPGSNFGSRNSLFWFVHDSGSIKIFSNEFQTDLLISQLLSTYEIGTILSMKYYIYRTMYRLQSVLRKKWSPQRLASFQHSELDIFHTYYNIDITSKDTTAFRFNKFLEIFHVDSALSIVQDRFRNLGDLIKTKYQHQLSNIQILLTLVFGTFGAAKMTYSIITRKADPNVSAYIFTYELITTCVSTLSIIVLLLIIVFFIRRK